MASFPSTFISHGPPTLLLDPAPARDFLSGLGETLGRPDAIVCVSAHWNTEIPVISTSENPETIYDFYNFPQPLYEATYPTPGAPDLARRTANLLQKDGLDVDLDADRGPDHGAWVPLKLMYPDADIPVTQLSMQWPQSPGHHLAGGRCARCAKKESLCWRAGMSLTTWAMPSAPTGQVKPMTRRPIGHVTSRRGWRMASKTAQLTTCSTTGHERPARPTPTRRMIT